MSRVERKEYKETKVIKTRSPVRMKGSAQNLADFDNNLDNLLDDLQNSVTDNTSGSNTTYREIRTLDSSGRTNAVNRITNLRAANPVIEFPSEESYSYTSPDGTKSIKTVKKEVYSYQTAGESVPEKSRMQNNINQLDSLLDDLQQVKQSSGSYAVGADPGFQEYSKSKVVAGKTIVEREIVYPETPKSSRSRTLERTGREGSVSRELQYSSDGTYGDIKSLRTTSPSPTRGNTLSKQTKVTNVHTYPLEVVETTTPDINPDILASLDPNLIPPGNTKVTTTIKTYTYEIPAAVYPSPNSTIESEQYVYSPNHTETTPSKSFVYNKYENNSLSRNVNYQGDPGWPRSLYEDSTTDVVNHPPYQKPAPPIESTDRAILKETVTTRNYQPETVYREVPGKQTYIYNESTTTKRSNDYLGYPDNLLYPSEVVPSNRGYPAGTPPGDREYPKVRESPSKTIIVKETHTTNIEPPYRVDYPPHNPNDTTVIYKHDHHTTNNYINKPYPKNDNVDSKYPPYGGSGKPNEPVNITYKYSSSSSSTNNYKGGYPTGEESEPLLHARPFPLDDGDAPPKKLDELMATIGREPPNGPLNAGYNAHEIELAQQKKVDTLKQQHQELEQKKEAKDFQRTKNVTGPPVYYPPGHEMFAKKEESGGWRAEGAMAKESGKYKYEAESKSKTKTKSGAAIVPVCLPLCCALPCTIL